jgi:hypothetical protein
LHFGAQDEGASESEDDVDAALAGIDDHQLQAKRTSCLPPSSLSFAGRRPAATHLV